jgi:hypothetical protein
MAEMFFVRALFGFGFFMVFIILLRGLSEFDFVCGNAFEAESERFNEIPGGIA